jgi:hypothetical protein
MCSTEVKPSCAASFTSFVVTSLAKSSQARPLPSTNHRASPVPASSEALGSVPRLALRPSVFSASFAASLPSAQAGRGRHRPVAGARRDHAGHGPGAGRKALASASQTGRAPRWQVRCTEGFQPPDMARQSVSISSVRPPWLTVIWRSPWRPLVSRPDRPRSGGSRPASPRPCGCRSRRPRAGPRPASRPPSDAHRHWWRRASGSAPAPTP